MLSRSYLDSLNMASADDFRALNRIPNVMKLPGIISEFSGDTCPETDTVSQERRVIVSNQLPIRAYRDEGTKKWCFEYDADSLVLQLKDGFGADADVWYVGCLKADIEASEQKEVRQLLHDKFHCEPVFMSNDMYNKYYHGFCKHYLWPLFHYMQPLSQSHGARFDEGLWRAYCGANIAFSHTLSQVLVTGDEFVWIHDYHLMLVPSFVRKKYRMIKLGFFLHSLFPSSEIYKTIPVRKDIIMALLNCDLIGFHTFDYARHFLSCCSRLLGIDYESKRGFIGIDYCGRTVGIKILPVGIHAGQLESVLSSDETVKKVKELKEKFEGKIVMVGDDDMDIFKGIDLKFLALGQLLEEIKDMGLKVIFVQILNPARSRGKDVQDVQSEVNRIAKEINEQYGELGYEPIVIINGPVSTQEKAAYYAIAECCVVNAVRDGMNLVPYTYTFCRQGSAVLDMAMGVDKSLCPKKSVIIVSEFIGCSPSLSGAIRVNPWNIVDVSNAMHSAITMLDSEKQLRHEKHYKYISSHDVGYWARSFDQDLERACSDRYEKRCWGIGLGLGYRIVALKLNFRKLALDPILSDYKEKNNRLILLDYDGTTTPRFSVDKKPSSDVISVLNCLCNDPKNIVFIVSGRGKEPLSQWFSPCEKLGLSAEHGFFTRWHKDSTWETCSLTMDSHWKEIVEPIMQQYTDATDGSYIEHKESAMVWHYQDTDPDFGSCQAKELHDHLESVLANEPVVVKRGHDIVEVKPQGVSKGIVVEKLISTMQSSGESPDFVLCIGDDRSDEDMFESIERMVGNPPLPATTKVYACTVGQKPSMASFYLDDTGEVIRLLQGLASASPQPKSAIVTGTTRIASFK
ncbi:Glyco_transf_20 domain-containing protein/Trehalose_PPase domain-containing protein [Cephalotus follicularis]|uniref:Glyco_transf_20 domain-containing protein/Trehalose_PPase domain-containing protein n=1 Tax=Cephalotus follicularis TaxID=3775 RepID=A0A1Q3BTD8_CEPFO|nr:Glyco_transf_20 domain-containing protein/Trehalose_PPase domain-containing protein [Cephalotus follicularis]